MRKTFVLDTNVLLQSPMALFSFKDNIVVLPEIVLNEIDKFKIGKKEININAREVAKTLDKLRYQGKLTKGVKINDGGLLIVETNKAVIDKLNNSPDNEILMTCEYRRSLKEDVHLVTKDIVLRIKADVLNIPAEDFESEMAPKVHEQYKGRRDIYIPSQKIDQFFANGNIQVEGLKILKEDGSIDDTPLVNNEFIIMHNETNPSHTAIGRFLGKNNTIVKLYYADTHPYGVTPRNVGQKFMLEALMSSVSTAPLVIIKGPAGTAKTFMSLAVGLQKTLENNEFRRILVCRPNITMDEDLGFLPGTEKEKIAPLMRPIYDNLEILVDSDGKHRYDNEKDLAEKVQYIFEKGYIDMQAVGYLRGRSITKHYIIIDEAQNLTPTAAKGIITRAGKDTKIILCGDPQQIDNAFLDERTNGLSYISELMKDSPLCWQLTCDDNECVRSPLAMDAIKRIKD